MTEMTDKNIDYDVRAFAEMLTELPAWTPIAAWFEESDPQKSGRWWCSQREHLIFYFMERLFPFPFYRERKGYGPRGLSLSAKEAYRYLGCPEAIVWLAEALQVVPAEELKSICGDALKIKRGSGRLKFIKDTFTWEKIVEKAKCRPELKGRGKQQKDLEKRSEALEDSTLLQVDVVDKQEVSEY